MDIFSSIWYYYTGFAQQIPDPVYNFLINGNALLLIPCALAGYAFHIGWRHPAILTLLIVLGAQIALGLPLEQWLGNYAYRPYLIPFLIVGLLFLPWVLAFLLETRFGPQRRLRRLLQQGLILLFLLNLIWSYLL